MLHGIDACLWPAVGWNALHNRLQVRRAYSNERVHWLSCNILIVLQRCDVSIADLVRRVRRIHITEFQFTLVNIFCLSMHDQHSTQEYAPLCEDHFVITIGGFDVLFRMFNNNLKLCLLLLLLLSLLLSYSVAVVIYIFITNKVRRRQSCHPLAHNNTSLGPQHTCSLLPFRKLWHTNVCNRRLYRRCDRRLNLA